LRRPEQRLAPEPDLKVWETAMILYERMRQRAEAAGQPFDRLPPARPERGARYLSAAETLRLGRQRAYERNRGNRNSCRYCELTLPKRFFAGVVSFADQFSTVTAFTRRERAVESAG
jgi:hypothetical protein